LSQAYAIRSLGEARAYLAHPLLGPRLNATKFRSSMTRFYASAPDPATDNLLRP
jgi:uncharacterized protein (DUF1810 family)